MGRNLPAGVIVAPVLPLRDGGAAIDEDALRAELRRLASTTGVAGVAVNAVASEGPQLLADEALQVVRATVEECGPDVVVVSGLREENPSVARERIAAHAAAGADAILVQAPPDFGRGGSRDLAIAHGYFSALAEVEVPLIVFQHQTAGGRAYPTPVLVELLGIDHVDAVKETTWEVAAYERDVRAIRAAHPDALVYCGNDTLLLPCLATAPADGLILGLAALCPEEIVALFEAIGSCDLVRAREINDRLAPLIRSVYADPPIAYYPRVKAAMQALGRLPDDVMRAPVQRLDDTARNELVAALRAAGLLSS